MSKSFGKSFWSLGLVLAMALAPACGGGDDDGDGSGADARPPVVDSAGGGDAVVIDGAPLVDTVPASVCDDLTDFTAGLTTSGTTLGRGASTYEGFCTSGESGPEIAYTFVAPSNGTLSLTLMASADLGLALLTTCGDPETEVACEDAGFAGDIELLEYEVVAGTTYYVLVDGYEATEASAFTLEARLIDFAGLCSAATAVTGTASGTTVGGSLEFSGSCTGVGSPSAIYTYTPGAVGETGDLTITLASATDQGVYVRSACASEDTESLCSDIQIGGTNEVIRVPARGGEPLTIFVDGFVPGNAGPHTLDVAFAVATCGNGVVEGLEACDAAGLPTAACSIGCTVIAPTTETNCNDLTDEDGDEAFDCRDTDCIAQCTPGAGGLATACDAPNDCAALGNDPVCLDEVFFGWPNGHCSQYCDPAASEEECGTGNLCFSLGGDGTLGVCLKGNCVDPATDCPTAGYACRAVTGGSVCWTGCTADAQCPLTGKCDEVNGFCVPPELCTNGLDDDFDLHADCSDLDCAGTGACPAATDVEPNDTFATATPFVGPFTGSIGIVDDVDFISVVVAGPAQTLTVKIHDGGSGDCAAGRLDPTLEILAPDGTTRVAYADDMASGNWCSRGAAAGLAAGTYFVRIDSNPLFAPTDTFIYTMDVSLTP